MLHTCETCGRMFTPHAFKVHRNPICMTSEKEMKRAGLFMVKLDPHQVKSENYPSNMYWASLGMFTGLSLSCIPWEYLRSKGMLPQAFNRL